MHAEAGFEADESTPPLRISGFLCLLFGVLSILSPIGRPMLVLPLISFVLGFVALKRSDDKASLGTRAALVGLVLAAGFGMCGLMLPMLKTMTLARQAEKFSRYYIEVIALEEDEFAMELNKDYVNRFPETMSLKEHYHESEQSYQRFSRIPRQLDPPRDPKSWSECGMGFGATDSHLLFVQSGACRDRLDGPDRASGFQDLHDHGLPH